MLEGDTGCGDELGQWVKERGLEVLEGDQVAQLNWDGIHEKVTWRKDLKIEIVGQVDIREQSVPGSWNSQCKGPELGS
jgi:hypothetical protein